MNGRRGRGRGRSGSGSGSGVGAFPVLSRGRRGLGKGRREFDGEREIVNIGDRKVEDGGDTSELIELLATHMETAEDEDVDSSGLALLHKINVDLSLVDVVVPEERVCDHQRLQGSQRMGIDHSTKTIDSTVCVISETFHELVKGIDLAEQSSVLDLALH